MEEAIWGLADAFSGRLKIEFHSVMHVTEADENRPYTQDMRKTAIGFPEEPHNARKSHLSLRSGSKILRFPTQAIRRRRERRRQSKVILFPDLPLIGPNKLPPDFKMAA